MTASNFIDTNDSNANMYGCQPCPQCKSRYRAPFKRLKVIDMPKVTVIECSDCGYKEDANNEDY